LARLSTSDAIISGSAERFAVVDASLDDARRGKSILGLLGAFECLDVEVDAILHERRTKSRELCALSKKEMPKGAIIMFVAILR